MGGPHIRQPDKSSINGDPMTALSASRECESRGVDAIGGNAYH